VEAEPEKSGEVMSPRDQVPAVTRAFDILEYLQIRNGAVSLNELSTALEIPRASAFRIVKTLMTRGYVAQPKHDGLYVLGASFLALGSRSLIRSNLSEIANPFMYELAAVTGQTIQLGVLFEYQVIYVEQIRVAVSLTFAVPTFQPYAVNLSAGGKVLVAFMDDDRKSKFFENATLARNTPKSIVDKAEFARELEKVKKQGYAVDDEEFAQGVRCVAAPVFDGQGRNVASIGVTGHILEVTDLKIEQLIKQTVSMAKRLSFAL
jgi:DNA-binding IclR family transcriptional regulator